MRHLLLSAIFAGCMAFMYPLSGQTDPCEVGHGISTNPASPVNPEKSYCLNKFDWKLNYQSGSQITPQNFTVNNSIGNWTFENPFYGSHSDLAYYPYIPFGPSSTKNDYYSENGWELVKVDLGYKVLNMSTQSYPGAADHSPLVPYILLYNKYTGTLRFFGALQNYLTLYKTIAIHIYVPTSSNDISTIASPNSPNYYNADLKTTNLLSIQGESVQPLDENTKEWEMTVMVKSPNQPQFAFWFDMPVAYDPCVCLFKSQLTFDFTYLEEASFTATGLLEGEIVKTEQDNSGHNFVSLLVSRVLGVALSTGVAVATDGAVVNVKSFVDLVDIFSQKPGLATDQKEGLDDLHNFLSCSANMFNSYWENKDDLDKVGNKKNEAIKNVVEAGTEFFSSIANGCDENAKDGGNMISAKLSLQGQITTENDIQGDNINLAMPGSGWDTSSLYEFEHPDSITGKTIPAYPLYNERLGTFALLETPVIDYKKTQDHLWREAAIPSGYNYYSNSYYSFRLKNNLKIKYAFNPKMNVNTSKTNVYVRLYIKDGEYYTLNNGVPDTPTRARGVPGASYYNYGQDPYSGNLQTPISIAKYDGYYYSPYVPIDQFGDMMMRASFDNKEGWSLLSLTNSQQSAIGWANYFGFKDDAELEKHVFLQFKVEFVSNTLNKDQQPNQSLLYFTYPVKFNSDFTSDFIPTSGNINLADETKIYGNSTTFSDDQTLAYSGKVYISSDMSTATGKKVKIYAVKGFEVQPGATINPSIELIHGYPFPGNNPQPQANYNYISDFCHNNGSAAGVYRAKDKAATTTPLHHVNIKNREAIHPAKQELNVTLYPNPASNRVNIGINSTNKGQDYQIEIFDLSGRLMESHSQHLDNSSGIVSMDANALSDGIYLVRVSCLSTGETKTQRLAVHKS